MLTVFVAEDQLLIQKDLCIKLIKARSDIEIVGTALNGQEAYEKIKTLKPDILFTDIKMPVETGLSLIRRLKEENNPVRTVILSGYREFEYARQSLKLGVDEYLLKPVSIEDLSCTLDSLWEKIETERERELLSALTGLVNNRGGACPPDLIQSKLNSKYYYALLVHTGSLPMIPLTDIYIQKDCITSLSKEELSRKYLRTGEALYIIRPSKKEDIFLLLCLNDLRNNKIELICKDIIHNLQEQGEPVTICVSGEMTIPGDLGINSNFMRTQLASQLTFGFSSILYQKDFILAEEAPELLDNTADRQFQFDIRTRNCKSFLKHLGDFLKTCREKRITQKSLDYSLKKILDYFISSSGKQTLQSVSLELDEYLSISKNYEELSKSLCFLFEQLFKNTFMELHTHGNTPALVQNVMEYIHGHFSEEINIQDIASQFSITPAYLSRLFKKQTNIPPIEYLTKYRIEQACYYFTHTQMSIGEVAELCGYSNQFYFSKAFKAGKGMSPSEYRIKYQEELR